MLKQTGCKSSELLAALQAMFATSPWAAAAFMVVLTPKQRASLLNGDAHKALRAVARRQSAQALDMFGLGGRHVEDVTHEVLLKLVEGKWLHDYDPARVHSAALVAKAAYQYARTLARSRWRRDRRVTRLEE